MVFISVSKVENYVSNNGHLLQIAKVDLGGRIIFIALLFWSFFLFLSFCLKRKEMNRKKIEFIVAISTLVPKQIH